MRGPLAGLGDSAAAKAIHREASPGLRLRSKAHGALKSPLPRPEPTAPACTATLNSIKPHTEETEWGVHRSSTNTGEPLHAHSQTLPYRLPVAHECPGHKTEHPRARTGGARALEVPCPQSSQLSLLPSPRPPRSPPTGQTGKGEVATRSQVPPSPLAKLWAARPPPLATAGDPFPQLTPHWLQPGTARPFVVMEPGTPITSSPPQLLVLTALAG